MTNPTRRRTRIFALAFSALLAGCVSAPDDQHRGETETPAPTTASNAPTNGKDAKDTKDTKDTTSTVPSVGRSDEVPAATNDTKPAPLPDPNTNVPAPETPVRERLPETASPLAPANTIACAVPGDAVDAAYRIALLRDPDPPGRSYWLLQIQAGQARIEMLRNIVRSVEFSNARVGLTDTQFVTSLYSGFLSRAPEPGGFAYWVDALAKGTPRTNVALSFIDSDEFRTDTDHACFY